MSDLLSFRRNEPLSRYSTFQIGGPAQIFQEVQTVEECQELMRYCSLHKLPFFVLGKGSNTLFDDRGFAGLVILNKISFCKVEGVGVHVGAGYSFSLLGTQTAKLGLSGLEFASGIPGTVGGAVYMNAGANGGETVDTLRSVEFVDEEGILLHLSKDELEFSYRHSSFQKRKGMIVGARFELTAKEEARAHQLGLLGYRMKTQPYQDPSIGCVFRNPEKYSAGALIEQAGLKGKRIGGAEVSLMHGNFIVNRDNATAQDVLELAKLVQSQVKAHHGIDLELEMRHIPYTDV